MRQPARLVRPCRAPSAFSIADSNPLSIQQPLRAARAEDDHVIEALPPHGSDEPFDDAALPWRTWRGEHFCHGHRVGGGRDGRESEIPAANQIPWRFGPRECFSKPLRGPRRGRILRRCDAHDAPALVASITKTNNRRPVAVGTTKKSAAVICWT
jgi:hypothetical protein